MSYPNITNKISPKKDYRNKDQVINNQQSYLPDKVSVSKILDSEYEYPQNYQPKTVQHRQNKSSQQLLNNEKMKYLEHPLFANNNNNKEINIFKNKNNNNNHTNLSHNSSLYSAHQFFDSKKQQNQNAKKVHDANKKVMRKKLVNLTHGRYGGAGLTDDSEFNQKNFNQFQTEYRGNYKNDIIARNTSLPSLKLPNNNNQNGKNAQYTPHPTRNNQYQQDQQQQLRQNSKSSTINNQNLQQQQFNTEPSSIKNRDQQEYLLKMKHLQEQQDLLKNQYLSKQKMNSQQQYQEEQEILKQQVQQQQQQLYEQEQQRLYQQKQEELNQIDQDQQQQQDGQELQPENQEDLQQQQQDLQLDEENNNNNNTIQNEEEFEQSKSNQNYANPKEYIAKAQLEAFMHDNEEYFKHLEGKCLCLNDKCGQCKCVYKQGNLKPELKQNNFTSYLSSYNGKKENFKDDSQKEIRKMQYKNVIDTPLALKSTAHAEFTEKNGSKPSPIISVRFKQQHDFIGRSTYGNQFIDFKSAQAFVPIKQSQDKTVITSMPFYGQTLYHSDFQQKDNAKRKPTMNSYMTTTVRSPIPFMAETTNNKYYKSYRSEKVSQQKAQDEIKVGDESYRGQFQSQYQKNFVSNKIECPGYTERQKEKSKPKVGFAKIKNIQDIQFQHTQY